MIWKSFQLQLIVISGDAIVQFAFILEKFQFHYFKKNSVKWIPIHMFEVWPNKTIILRYLYLFNSEFSLMTDLSQNLEQF